MEPGLVPMKAFSMQWAPAAVVPEWHQCCSCTNASSYSCRNSMLAALLLQKQHISLSKNMCVKIYEKWFCNPWESSQCWIQFSTELVLLYRRNMPGSDFSQWAQLRLQRLPLQSIAFFTLWICTLFLFLFLAFLLFPTFSLPQYSSYTQHSP